MSLALVTLASQDNIDTGMPWLLCVWGSLLGRWPTRARLQQVFILCTWTIQAWDGLGCFLFIPKLTWASWLVGIYLSPRACCFSLTSTPRTLLLFWVVWGLSKTLFLIEDSWDSMKRDAAFLRLCDPLMSQLVSWCTLCCCNRMH